MRKVDFLDDAEYAEIGFRCGLEIHQQLDTKQKLFCHCPVGLTDREPDMQILRHMRPTLSELGEYDGTALMEFKTRKEVVYQLYNDLTCTYEMDDTPPFPINKEALEIAIEIALLLNCRIVDEVHVTRKQYLDGSIPTGFQRTAVVGVDGWIPYKDRRIRIAMLTIEEDACREVSDIGHTITFKTDRLSTPLVEVITHPDILSPREVPEVNWLLADLMRATGKVRRGIGTVRQDVNVSVTGGARCEIKGVPKIKYHAALTHIEAMRQLKLLELREECKRRDLNKDSLVIEREVITDLLRSTRSLPVRSVIEAEGDVVALCLRNCAGLFGHPTQPGSTFADELAGRIRVVACIDSTPNLLHSDSPVSGGLNEREWNALRSLFRAEECDLLAIVFGEKADVRTAAGEVEIRLLETFDGIPMETRQYRPDGNTGFERILPGPDRMYPDTDTPPTSVSSEWVRKILSGLPELPWDREQRYLEIGLNPVIAKPLARSLLAFLFDAATKKQDFPLAFVASTVLALTREFKTRGYPSGRLDSKRWVEALELLQAGRISRDRLLELLILLAEQPDEKPENLLNNNGLACLEEDEVDGVCQEIAETWQPKSVLAQEAAVRFLIGQVMRRIGKRYSGEAVVRKITKLLRNRGLKDGSE